MKQFQIVITHLKDDGNVDFYERLEADTLVQTVMFFNLALARLAQQLSDDAVIKERDKHINDDIPF